MPLATNASRASKESTREVAAGVVVVNSHLEPLRAEPLDDERRR
jgi:hypothetical protein